MNNRIKAAILASVLAVYPMPALSAGPKSGQAFGDWVFECTAIAQGETACALRQTLMPKNGNKPVAVFALARRQNVGDVMLTAILPLGLEISSGVKGVVDGGTAYDYELQTCIPRGCVASVKINGPLREAFLSGVNFTTTFKLHGAKQDMNLAGSLKGVSEGLAALEAE
jgi:invasion protein IalB